MTLIVYAEDISTTLSPFIYTNLNNWPCVRLLHASGTVGCQALQKKTGVLFALDDQQAIDDFTNNKPSDDYAIVIPFHLLTQSNLDALAHTGKVAGLIVLIHSQTIAFSPDSACPNCAYGLYANDTDPYQWNSQAGSLIQATFDFPIFAVRPENELSQQVYQNITQGLAFNQEHQYPLKAVDFEAFMWAAIDTETCLRRGWCQPIGGFSVYSTPSLTMTADDHKPIIVVSASLDSRSLFHDLTVGANQVISSVVTVLGIAEAMNKAPIPMDNLPKHILYTLFAAEPWGFAGSQRFVQDISTPFVCTNATRANKCPYLKTGCTFPCVRSTHFTRINMDQIESIFEFQSVSGINANYSNTYYVHVDDQQTSQSIVDALTSNSQIQTASSDGLHRKLPPSSAMSFLQKKRSIKAAVVTDYQKELGMLYNNDQDDFLDMDKATQSICQLVNTTAKAIYREASNSSTADAIRANCTLISSLLDCLVYNFSCPLMQNYFNVSGISRIPHYTSVFSFENPQTQLMSMFALNFLSDMNGQRREVQGQPISCHTINDCQSGELCIKKECTFSITAYHEAYGTGLQYDESAGRLYLVDPAKPAWTESTWNTPSMRIFLVTSYTHQVVEFVVGLLWISLSIVTVFFLKKYLKKTFKTE
ncbi:Nicastrin-domain-containing protein [Choanephora cucurbitarum]|nr:Nicastrin-domain-containing protein [Choanephora cucurbitarum]